MDRNNVIMAIYYQVLECLFFMALYSIADIHFSVLFRNYVYTITKKKNDCKEIDKKQVTFRIVMLAANCLLGPNH